MSRFACPLARKAVATAALATLTLGARASFAEGEAAADALFRAGRSALQRGDWTEAAARFEESYRLDPAPGTLLNLAVAEEKLGRLSAAWEHARAAGLTLSPDDERARLSRELFNSLDGRLPRITLRAGSNLTPEAHVFLDGKELRSASFGIPLPVDPGKHAVVVRSPHHTDRAFDLVVDEGVRAEQIAEPGPSLPTEGPDAERPRASPVKLLGYGMIAGGALSLATGVITGVLTLDRKATVEQHCFSACDRDGYDASQSGKTFSTVSTVSFVVGGVLLAGGIVMVLVAPRTGAKGSLSTSTFATAVGSGLRF